MDIAGSILLYYRKNRELGLSKIEAYEKAFGDVCRGLEKKLSRLETDAVLNKLEALRNEVYDYMED